MSRKLQVWALTARASPTFASAMLEPSESATTAVLPAEGPGQPFTRGWPFCTADGSSPTPAEHSSTRQLVRQ